MNVFPSAEVKHTNECEVGELVRAPLLLQDAALALIGNRGDEEQRPLLIVLQTKYLGNRFTHERSPQDRRVLSYGSGFEFMVDHTAGLELGFNRLAYVPGCLIRSRDNWILKLDPVDYPLAFA